MRDIILCVVVIAYMIGAYFVAGKIGEFIDQNYKCYDYELESEDESEKNEQ